MLRKKYILCINKYISYITTLKAFNFANTTINMMWLKLNVLRERERDDDELIWLKTHVIK